MLDHPTRVKFNGGPSRPAPNRHFPAPEYARQTDDVSFPQGAEHPLGPLSTGADVVTRRVFEYTSRDGRPVELASR